MAAKRSGVLLSLMILSHQNTHLRPFCSTTDLTFLATLRNDIDLQANLLSQARANSLENVAQWAQSKNHNEGVFFVVANLAQEPLGFIQAQKMNYLQGHAELGICLDPTAQHQGHGKAACYLLEKYLLDVFQLRKLMLYVRSDNTQAIRFYHHINYREVGTLKAHFYYQQTYFDVTLMEKMLS